MSHLLTYLNSNFPAGFNNQELIDHFINEFGVNVKIEDDLYLFKYDMIQVKWNDITKECRGHILKNDVLGWQFVSRPWDKFYNLGEGHCPITDCDDFSAFDLVQKADGSAIQLYHHNGEWYASTLGTIVTMCVGDLGITFSELFFQVLPNISDVTLLDPEFTYLFELTTKYNRIVTQYDQDQIFLLGARHKVLGIYMTQEAVAQTAQQLNVIQPISFPCNYHNLITKERIIDFVEEQSTDPRYGKNSEGFIVYNNGVPLAKLKNIKYVNLHHISGGDPLASRNNILELVFQGKIDDVYGDLLPEFQEYVDKIQVWVNGLWQDVSAAVKAVHAAKPQTRKDYAMLVKDHKAAGLLFQHYDAICNMECLNIEHFNDYLKNRWKAYEVELKELYTN